MTDLIERIFIVGALCASIFILGHIADRAIARQDTIQQEGN
jgi:hypothetical protein